MKSAVSLALCGCATLIGFAVGSWHSSQRLNTVKTVTVSAEESNSAMPDSPLPPDQLSDNESQPPTSPDTGYWKAEAEKLQKDAQEVHRLRNDVSRLNAELQAVRQKQSQIPAPVVSQKQTQAPSKETPNQKNVLTPAEAPAEIQAAITREVGSAQVKALVAHSVDGQTRYGLKGLFNDGRYFAVNLAEDGSLLEKHQQIQAEALPPEVATALQQNFGEFKIADASHVIDGDNQFYKLVAKSAERGMEIAIRPDGSIISYSAKFSDPQENLLIKK